MIKEILNKHEDLRKFLFIRGFLLTDSDAVSGDDFPFYGQWQHCTMDKFHVWHHPLTGFHKVTRDDKCCFLFGHAYNPFTMEIDECRILDRILTHFGDPNFYDYVDELTGIFLLGIISGGKVFFINDPSGMQSACLGRIRDHFYATSHPELVADICDLKMDPFVKMLVEYRWYPRVLGGYLPGDLTPFAELKRIVPNQEYVYDTVSAETAHRRFYPLKDISECKTDAEYQCVIKSAANILKNNMELVIKKWDAPWISLTGGIDSNTTFAAANGSYDKLHAFSYISAPKEVIDSDAAKVIAEKFCVPWVLYHIPDGSEELERFNEKAAIINHNNAYIAKTPTNELRKRVYLQENCPADVEIKSWTSETIRGYWYKYYGRKSMPRLSAKLYRNLYKIFLADRKLAHQIDKIFAKYIEDFEYRVIPAQYPPADMHYSEVSWGSWGSLNISEMKYCFDITIIYNNRRFLDLLFKVPLAKRISDQHHLDMKRYLNRVLYDMNIRVVNMKETKFRAFALNVIFTANSILP